MDLEATGERSAAAAGFRGAILPYVLLLVLTTPACLVKRTVNVPVPARIAAAKTATLDELLSSLANYGENIQTLSSSSLKASFTSGKVESGRLQEYRSAPGYLLLKRPDSILMNIQNPVTKSTLFELLSVGDDFSIWYTRENKLFVGKNSMKDIEVEGHSDLSLRPVHIIDALLPQKIDLSKPETALSMEEERDASARYYVLTVFREDARRILHPRRRVWIERSQLAVTRQEMFNDEGKIVSDIAYSRLTALGAWLLPLSVKIDRPEDGYSLDLEFRDWRVNPDFPEDAFRIKAPPGAQRVELKEKGKSG